MSDQRCPKCNAVLHKYGKFQCDGYHKVKQGTCKNLIEVIAVSRPIAARWHSWRDRHPVMSNWMFPIVLLSIFGVLFGLGLLWTNHLQKKDIERMARSAPIQLRNFVRGCAREVLPDYIEQAKSHIREVDYEKISRYFQDFLDANETDEYEFSACILPGCKDEPKVELLIPPFVLIGDIQQAMMMQKLFQNKDQIEAVNTDLYQKLEQLHYLFTKLNRVAREVETFYYHLAFERKIYRADWFYDMNRNHHQLLGVFYRVLQSGDYGTLDAEIDKHYKELIDSGVTDYIRWERYY